MSRKIRVGDVILVRTDGIYHLPIDLVEVKEIDSDGSLLAKSLIEPHDNYPWWVDPFDYKKDYSYFDYHRYVISTKLTDILFGLDEAAK